LKEDQKARQRLKVLVEEVEIITESTPPAADQDQDHMEQYPRGCRAWLGFLGMTVKRLEEGYGHHQPDFQEEAAGAFSPKRADFVANSLRTIRSKSAKSLKVWSEWQDLNLRPPRPERGALPD
jgi:hypothetical protein